MAFMSVSVEREGAADPPPPRIDRGRVAHTVRVDVEALEAGGEARRELESVRLDENRISLLDELDRADLLPGGVVQDGARRGVVRQCSGVPEPERHRRGR